MINEFNDVYILKECQFIHALLPVINKKCYWNSKTVSKSNST